MKKKLLVLSLIGALCSCGGGENSQLSREDLSSIYGNVASYMHEVASGSDKNLYKRAYQESEDTSSLQSTVAFVKWSSNLYANETFLVTDELVEFRITVGNNLVDVCWLNNSDQENNKLEGTLVVSYGETLDPYSTILMHFDVDYNYETDQISAFEIIQIFWGDDILNECFKYDGNKFYILNYGVEDEEVLSVKEKGVAVKAIINEKLDSRIFLEEDYLQEYLDAMNFANA